MMLFRKLKIKVMRKLMFLAISAVAVYRAAKFFGIESLDDLKKVVFPKIKHLMHA